MPVPADNPIRSEKEDKLGRAPVARMLADEIRTLDASEGCVVGILGPWGSGKTSLVNLIAEELASPPSIAVLAFNPWFFSGTEALLETFFLEVGAQFRDRADRLADLASDVEAYAEVVAPLKWIPVVGVWVERVQGATRGVKKAAKRRRKGVGAQREVLAKKLSALEAPIVIVIDDIDRLRTDEIREIFKLVRLTANFPNVIYLLAFDRRRVETALSEEGLVGRDYLEKILQIAHDLPVVSDAVLTRILLEALEEGLKDIEEPGPLSPAAWSDIVFEVIRPLVRTMRDVRRYVAAARGTVRSLDGQVELSDVLALEAVRVFLPDVFSAVIEGQQGLTTTSSVGVYEHRDPPELKEQIEKIVAAADRHREVATALITRLFPAAVRHIENNHYGPEWRKEWIKERRVAHPDVLSFYLERVIGEKFEAFLSGERVYATLGNQSALQEELAALSDQHLADAIASLEVYEGDFPSEGVGQASAVLLNQVRRLPQRDGSIYSFEPDLTVRRVVLRMLRQLEDAEEIEAAVREALTDIDQLSDKYTLITLVGYLEHAGHKLISEEAAADLESELATQIRTASPDQLAAERDLLRVLYWAWIKAPTDSSEEFLLPDHPELQAQLLRDAVTEVRSQVIGTRATTSSARLHWDALVEVVGGEDVVQRMVEDVSTQASNDAKLDEARELAQKYLAGWRPSDL